MENNLQTRSEDNVTASDDYNSEAETEISFSDDVQNHNAFGKSLGIYKYVEHVELCLWSTYLS